MQGLDASGTTLRKLLPPERHLDRPVHAAEVGRMNVGLLEPALPSVSLISMSSGQ